MHDHLAQYRAWLQDEGYQESTIEATLRHLNNVAKTPGKDNALSFRAAHVRRYLLYVQSTKDNPLGQKFTDEMTLRHGLKAATALGKRGARTKRLLDEGQRYSLHQVLRRGDPLDKLLVAYMESPLKIKTFLNLRLREVNEDTVCHGWSRRWLAGLPSTPDKRLYEILALAPRRERRPYKHTPERAYARMRRRLIAVAADLGFKPLDFAMLRKSFVEREKARQPREQTRAAAA